MIHTTLATVWRTAGIITDFTFDALHSSFYRVEGVKADVNSGAGNSSTHQRHPKGHLPTCTLVIGHANLKME